MAVSRRCPNCHKTYIGRYCKECANKYSKHRQAKNERLKLYNFSVWQQCRKNVRLKYLDYDIWLLGIGELRKCDGVVVHHIQERDEAPELTFDLDNLITVGTDSHAEIHVMYKTDKEAALARIIEGKRKFEEMFG